MAHRFPPFGDRRHARIGLLGGSFNPAHDGHLHISREAIKRLGLDQVWWLVSPQNPLKPTRGMAPLTERLRIARDVAADAHVLVGDLETTLGSVRTAKVVAALCKRFPRIEFVWLMGADNLAQVPRWWRWTRIFETVRVAVLDRSPYAYRALAGAAANRFRNARVNASHALLTHTAPAWSYLAIRRHGASASAIRERQIETLSKQTQEMTIPTTKTSRGPETLVDTIMASLDADKGQNITLFDLAGKTSIADHMIVASGTSTRQVSSMAERLVTKLKSLGVNVRSEGKRQGDWVLVDAGDVIVHLFRPEVREFYDIERLWASAPIVKLAPVAKGSATKASPKQKRVRKKP